MNSSQILEIRNLSKSYGGVKAVDNVSFSVNRGEIVGLIGPNGAGKTTSFNTIAGAEKPTGGEVFLEGKNVTGRSTEQLYHMGLLRTFQLSQEYPKMTTMENLMVACKNQAGEDILMNWLYPKRVLQRELEVINKANQTLEFLGLSHVRNELAGNLSGGQKKKLVIALSLLSDPKVLLLDECFAALDVMTIKMLQEIIVNLQKETNITICICDHQARDLLACVDKAMILSNCKIVAEGSPQELVDNIDAKSAYFGDSFNFK